MVEMNALQEESMPMYGSAAVSDLAMKQELNHTQLRSLRGSIRGMTPGERQSRRLNDIIAGKGVPEILLTCERYTSQLHAVHFVTALHRIGKASDGGKVVGNPVFGKLTEAVFQVLSGSERDTQHISNATRELIALCLQCQRTWDRVCESCANKPPRFDPQNTSNADWPMGV